MNSFRCTFDPELNSDTHFRLNFFAICFLFSLLFVSVKSFFSVFVPVSLAVVNIFNPLWCLQISIWFFIPCHNKYLSVDCFAHIWQKIVSGSVCHVLCVCVCGCVCVCVCTNCSVQWDYIWADLEDPAVGSPHNTPYGQRFNYFHPVCSYSFHSHSCFTKTNMNCCQTSVNSRVLKHISLIVLSS